LCYTDVIKEKERKRKMTKSKATKLAQDAIKVVTVGNPEPIADTTVLYKNSDGTFTVCDNREEVECKTAATAERIIVENLTA
jgi:hypothetical protein